MNPHKIYSDSRSRARKLCELVCGSSLQVKDFDISLQNEEQYDFTNNISEETSRKLGKLFTTTYL